MRLPLLFHANPKAAKIGGTKVPLQEGKWRVVMEGVTNSRVFIHYDSPLMPDVNTAFEVHDGKEFDVEETMKVRARVAEVGTEEFINVFVESVNHDDSSIGSKD